MSTIIGIDPSVTGWAAVDCQIKDNKIVDINDLLVITTKVNRGMSVGEDIHRRCKLVLDTYVDWISDKKSYTQYAEVNLGGAKSAKSSGFLYAATALVASLNAKTIPVNVIKKKMLGRVRGNTKEDITNLITQKYPKILDLIKEKGISKTKIPDICDAIAVVETALLLGL